MPIRPTLLQIGLAAALFVPLIDAWVRILTKLFPLAGNPALGAVMAAAASAAGSLALARQGLRPLGRKRALR